MSTVLKFLQTLKANKISKLRAEDSITKTFGSEVME